MTRLVVGLGNPGREYVWTPHNMGFHVLQAAARHEGLIFEDGSSAALDLGPYTGSKAFRAARSFDPDARLVLPETWMNRSGDVVAPLVRSLGIEPSELLVVYDDLDLDLGVLRLRPHGGTGGHRGMSSIQEELGTDRYPRLRVGIGRPKTDAARYVLARFPADLQAVAEIAAVEAAEAVVDWMRTGDIERCMTRFHSRWNQGSAPQQ